MERRLTTIVAADVVGFSRLMAADEEGVIARLRSIRADIVDPTVAVSGGRIFKTMGDGLFVEFPSPVAAVRTSISVQETMAARETGPERDRMRFRIGINLGDVVEDGDDILGDGVNVAARLESLASPGGICISRSVHDHLRGKVDARFTPMRPQRIKNIPDTVDTWRVEVEGAAPPPMVYELPEKPSKRWRRCTGSPPRSRSREPGSAFRSPSMTTRTATAKAFAAQGCRNDPAIAWGTRFQRKGLDRCARAGLPGDLMADKDTPGVIAPPPLLMLGTLVIGALLERAYPIGIMPPAWGIPAMVIGGAIMLSGLCLGFWAIIGFRRAGTNVEPYKPALKLALDGPYRFTRNPMYIGLTLSAIGISFLTSIEWGLAMIVPMCVVLHYGVVLREEAYLTTRFGQPYTDYLARTRRWL